MPLICLVLAGCHSNDGPKLPVSTINIHHFTLTPITSDPATQPSESQSHRNDPIYIYLEMYRLRLPFGAISASDTFWSKVNEQALGARQSRLLLYRNGIRVGTASIDHWEYFKNLIDQYPTRSQKSTLTGGDGQAVELEIRSGVPGQTIFYFDNEGQLHGRTYDASDDLLAIYFQPSPRAYANVRISLCPIVRATRKRLEFTPMNNEREVQYVTPQKLYDMGLVADLVPGQFLIVAPSPEAKHPTRLGHVFLVEDGSAERYEQVLIIVPHIYRARDQGKALK